MIIIKKEKIVHGIKIVKNRDFFLRDKNRFERAEQLCLKQTDDVMPDYKCCNDFIGSPLKVDCDSKSKQNRITDLQGAIYLDAILSSIITAKRPTGYSTGYSLRPSFRN